MVGAVGMQAQSTGRVRRVNCLALAVVGCGDAKPQTKLPQCQSNHILWALERSLAKIQCCLGQGLELVPDREKLGTRSFHRGRSGCLRHIRNNWDLRTE